MNKKHLSLALSILFACFVALSAACTTPAGRTADEVVGDTGVTAQIKTALMAIRKSAVLPLAWIPLTVR